MSFDHQAATDQIARTLDHAGTGLTFGALDPFKAAISAWQPPATDVDRNVGDRTSVLVKVARAVFGDRLPRQGEAFLDTAGRNYRIQAIRSTPPTLPTIEFICGSVA